MQFVLPRLYFQASCISGWVEFGDSSISARGSSVLLGINPGKRTVASFPPVSFSAGPWKLTENSVTVEEPS